MNKTIHGKQVSDKKFSNHTMLYSDTAGEASLELGKYKKEVQVCLIYRSQLEAESGPL